MPLLARYKLRWNGFNGAPGYSVFHMRDFVGDDTTVPDIQGGANKILVFATRLQAVLPANVNLSLLPDVEVIDEATGEIREVRGAVVDPPKFGSAAAGTGYAAAVGAVITWRTGIVIDGRRLKGRTFLVPLTAGAFQNDGSLLQTTVDTLNTAATGLHDSVGSPDLGVYSRPRKADPVKNITAREGRWALVTTHSVPDMGAVLRSRRD
jgi:hypothetical protein